MIADRNTASGTKYGSMCENERALNRATTRWWSVVLMFLISSPIYLNYWVYSSKEKQHPEWAETFFSGRANAPEQYRIGIPWLARFAAAHLHLTMSHIFAAIDLLASFVAVLLLNHLLQRLLSRANATWQLKLLSNSMFIGLVLFYFIWIGWYQSPDTLPSAMYVAVTLFLTVRRISIRGGRLLAAVAIIGLAMVQGLIRADVAASMHLAILCVCILDRHKQDDDIVSGRVIQACISGVALVSACAVQLYLMRVLYPKATYGDTPVIQFVHNFAIARVIPFALFTLPAAVTWIMLLRRRTNLDAGARIMLVASMIYLALWFVVGSIAEVRIFLPFALALSPYTVIALCEELMRTARFEGRAVVTT